ncbi:MAG: aminotransferase class I/II-fold pyridoxal phosphate-dependent enzyme [Lentisphaerae bacterium]|jgi:cysteine-S-conjugate beta-lyase|nr:aminotransferase class I/II-fold pyridoxal phosphate-dependent enzyme [Lentisphaerota bacterium]MBT4814440.1 aminotransferase class I/II-fold pyridoxal phosphate-dependent enzyme [Lentisphaerota bacterium]MBT5611541.1 aminotransferase class I/II-fold pyridoxal phosphate-dependent enzyme [Lentisphaerota bacterium]MBT7059568.1 aminotransferase class I/II-fold pyridoxal phosphate-dependent enzyme [Lentisphaerota bacterium]MBT7844968.1 aminotransferase class I/II-fold pyridoxal phosphate-depende
MSTYDFDRFVDRRAINAAKWGVPEGIIPMSVADTEFLSPPEIAEAIRERAAVASYGYSCMAQADYDAVLEWIATHQGQRVPREHLLSTPGVLYTMRVVMYALTKPGDQVIVQTPLHTPSIGSAGLRQRVPVKNHLKRLPDGSYTFDLDDLERCFRNGARVLMMCAPNNPTGRVWTMEELSGVAEVVKKYDAWIVSDEIHRDIVYHGHKHIPIATLPGMEERAITVFSPSKTFNMGGFHIGSAIIADPKLRSEVKQGFYEYGHACGRPPVLCIAAQTAAYRHGAGWLEELLEYLDGNISLALEYLEGTPLTAGRPDGTFLLWVDCESLGMNTEELMSFMREKAHILPDPGHYYDTSEIQHYKGLQHHFRLNIAMPRPILEQAMDNLRNAVLAL